MDDPNLAIELQRFAVSAANIFGQLPEGAALFQMIPREIQRRQYLVNSTLVWFQAQNDYFGGVLLKKATNGSWYVRQQTNVKWEQTTFVWIERWSATEKWHSESALNVKTYKELHCFNPISDEYLSI